LLYKNYLQQMQNIYQYANLFAINSKEI